MGLEMLVVVLKMQETGIKEKVEIVQAITLQTAIVPVKELKIMDQKVIATAMVIIYFYMHVYIYVYVYPVYDKHTYIYTFVGANRGLGAQRAAVGGRPAAGRSSSRLHQCRIAYI